MVCFHYLFIYLLVANNAVPQICYATEKGGSFWPRVLEELPLVTAFLLAEAGEGCHTTRHRESAVSRDLSGPLPLLRQARIIQPRGPSLMVFSSPSPLEISQEDQVSTLSVGSKIKHAEP